MGSVTLTGGGGVTSYVGMIVHSTTLDTEAKVKEIYGGTTWIRHGGYFLRGATTTQTVTANDATKTGGTDNAIIPKHSHNLRVRLLNHGQEIGYGMPTPGLLPSLTMGTQYTIPGGIVNLIQDQPASVQSEGISGTDLNIPNYKAVYIWERTV